MKKLMTFVALLGMTSIGWAGTTRENVKDRLDNAGAVLHEIMAAPDRGIPEEVLEHARCIAVVPHMIKGGGGAILLISSAAGTRGCAGAIAYGVAKGAIPQFTRALARELADFDIRVNCVSPGIIRTRFQDYLTSEQVQNNTRNRIPLHREGKPEEVAAALAALAENDFITGAEVPVDGGMAMRMV